MAAKPSFRAAESAESGDHAAPQLEPGLRNARIHSRPSAKLEGSMSKFALTLALAAVASVALVACGGGSSSSSTTPPTPPPPTPPNNGGGGGGGGDRPPPRQAPGRPPPHPP